MVARSLPPSHASALFSSLLRLPPCPPSPFPWEIEKSSSNFSPPHPHPPYTYSQLPLPFLRRGMKGGQAADGVICLASPSAAACSTIPPSYMTVQYYSVHRRPGFPLQAWYSRRMLGEEKTWTDRHDMMARPRNIFLLASDSASCRTRDFATLQDMKYKICVLIH